MARAQAKVVRKPPKAVQVRVAAVVDGFLKVMPLEKKPVREKVIRKLRQLHPMD
jgi:hypothetical protein